MSIITITFQNQKARFSVQMEEEDAIAMIKNTPALGGTFEERLTNTMVCLGDEIFKALGITQPETTEP